MKLSIPKHLLGISLLLTVLIGIGCKEDEPTNTPPPTPETSITVTCKDTAAIDGVRVGIARDWPSCSSSSFLLQRSTDGSGKAKFENLTEGTYCIVCTRNQLGVETERTSEVELSLHERARVTVYF